MCLEDTGVRDRPFSFDAISTCHFHNADQFGNTGGTYNTYVLYQ